MDAASMNRLFELTDQADAEFREGQLTLEKLDLYEAEVKGLIGSGEEDALEPFMQLRDFLDEKNKRKQTMRARYGGG